jgi:hypothetical protein
MRRHLICLTIDCDPDGLSGVQTNRRALAWAGLEYAAEQLPLLLGDMPLTWFVRADGQLRDVLGSPLVLLDQYADFWSDAARHGHEIGWHPHLYRQPDAAAEPTLITDAAEAWDELESLWEQVKTAPFAWQAFRNGEGWHTPETFTCVEAMGFVVDSTAIPGRDDPPRDWLHAPNNPYFPSACDLSSRSDKREMLEVPMTTWLVQAPYDAAPKRRYMNPAVHETLFAAALEKATTIVPTDGLCVWTLILHPDEILPSGKADGLYAHSVKTLRQNLDRLKGLFETRGDAVEFVTLSDAAARWRKEELS